MTTHAYNIGCFC